MHMVQTKELILPKSMSICEIANIDPTVLSFQPCVCRPRIVRTFQRPSQARAVLRSIPHFLPRANLKRDDQG